jgi:hypothetical protein
MYYDQTAMKALTTKANLKADYTSHHSRDQLALLIRWRSFSQMASDFHHQEPVQNVKADFSIGRSCRYEAEASLYILEMNGYRSSSNIEADVISRA